MVQGDVQKIQIEPTQVTVTLKNGRRLSGDRLVIAAGIWSQTLARQVGDNLPLESERGYHAQLPNPGLGISRIIADRQQAIVIVPLDTGLRITGVVEFAGLKQPPNWRRAELLLAKAKAVLPGLKIDNASFWMGHRPSLPDGLPVVGFSSTSERVIHAFGHGHLGLTLAATTGRIVTDLAMGKIPDSKMGWLSASRFGG